MNKDEITTSTPKEILSELDKMNLELARQKRLTTLAEAKAALAANDNSELSYKYTVLQIYLKYGLNEKDAINENGEIVRGGANQVAEK